MKSTGRSEVEESFHRGGDGPKVLFFLEELEHYRLPLLVRLRDRYDWQLTVAVKNPPSISTNDIEVITYQSFTLGPLSIARLRRRIALEEYDGVVAMFNLHWLNVVDLLLRPRRHTLVFLWGIGLSSARGLRSRALIDWLRVLLAKRSDGLILYSDLARSFYARRGVASDKLPTARNSVSIPGAQLGRRGGHRSFLLFVGSLDARKKLQELLCSLAILKERRSQAPNLKIVGRGDEEERLRGKVRQLGLEDEVDFLGPIYDSERLTELYANAIATCSPGQAGLSVVEAMARGVPFITRVDAITGGEAELIRHEKNGLLYSGGAGELAEVVAQLVDDEELVEALGQTAFQDFSDYASFNLLVDAFGQLVEARMRDGKWES